MSNCIECGNELPAKIGRGRKQIYCNNTCKERYLRKASPRKGHLTICKTCGKEIFSISKKSFCSIECKRATEKKYQTRICAYCGKEFSGTNSRYCKKDCADKALKTRQSCKCKHCGKEYTPKASNRATFCSRECAFDWKRQRGIQRRLREQEEKAAHKAFCLICGKELTGRRTKYCSDECIMELARRTAYERNKAKSVKKSFVCKECGKSVVSEYGDKLRMFCSDDCRKKNGRRNGKDTRRARKKTQTIECFVRKEIFDRDNWICQICGKPIQKHRKAPHPMSPSIDHIIPLACGGTHERKNVQAAHFRCNSMKSDGVGPNGDQLRMFG